MEAALARPWLNLNWPSPPPPSRQPSLPPNPRCDLVGMLSDGALIAVGTPTELRRAAYGGGTRRGGA